jgi:uncharacterized protein (DUF433 family)
VEIIQTKGTVGGRPRIAGRRIEPQQVAYFVSENLCNSKDPYSNDLELSHDEILACILYVTTQPVGKWLFRK